MRVGCPGLPSRSLSASLRPPGLADSSYTTGSRSRDGEEDDEAEDEEAREEPWPRRPMDPAGDDRIPGGYGAKTASRREAPALGLTGPPPRPPAP